MKNKAYIIPFAGLKDEKHTFTYQIDDTFFESIENALIRKGNFNVTLELDKKERMMIADFRIKGIAVLECDRCNTPMEQEIDKEYQLIYKFGTEEYDDETLITIYPEEYELDVSQDILELINVSIPFKNTHKEGMCDQEAIKILNEYLLVEESDDEDFEEENEEEIDPRWEGLKDFNKGLRDN